MLGVLKRCSVLRRSVWDSTCLRGRWCSLQWGNSTERTSGGFKEGSTFRCRVVQDVEGSTTGGSRSLWSTRRWTRKYFFYSRWRKTCWEGSQTHCIRVFIYNITCCLILCVYKTPTQNTSSDAVCSSSRARNSCLWCRTLWGNFRKNITKYIYKMKNRWRPTTNPRIQLLH